MRLVYGVAALVAAGAVAAVALPGRGGGDLLLASSFRTYERSASDPAPQRLPRGREPVQVRATRVLGDSTSFGFIDDVAVIGNQLLLLDRYGSKPILFMDLADGRITRAFGGRGDGPGEYRWARSIDRVEHGPYAGTWVYDIQSGRLTQFDLDVRQQTPRRMLRAPSGLYSPVWFGDTLVSNGLFSQEMLQYFTESDKEMRKVRTAGHTPFGREVEDVAMILNRTIMAVPPSRTKMAAAYRYTSRVDFFDASGRLMHSAAGPTEITPYYRVVPDPRSKMNRWVPLRETAYAYLDVDATDEFVYALFTGRSHKDYKDTYDLGDQVHVFTWDGRLADVWKLDEAVTRIEVDVEGGRLFGARELPYPSLIEYRLPASAR